MIGFWKVHFRHCGRILFEEHASCEFAIDAACLRWLEDPKVGLPAPTKKWCKVARWSASTESDIWPTTKAFADTARPTPPAVRSRQGRLVGGRTG